MVFRVLLLTAVVVSITACNVASHVRMRYANDNLTVNWPADVEHLPLKTHYIGEKPHVYVEVNGQSGFLFLIDSGASLTYFMDTPQVRALNLPQGYDLQVGGWGSQEDSKVYQSQVATLALEEAFFEDVNVAYLPVSHSRYYASPNEAIIDGVLGHDILRHFAWRFDKKHNRIDVSPQSFSADENDIAIPFDISFSKLSVPAKVTLNPRHTVERDILIDTGSRHFFKLNQTYLDEEDISLSQRSVTGADFGLSGRAVHQRVTLPQVQVGDWALNNVKTNLIKTEDPDDFWVIGSAALSQFITILDYHTGHLIVRNYPKHSFKSRYNLLGLELRKNRQDNFVVRYVMPDMAGATTDFQEGDIITRINGRQSPTISQEDWLKLTDTPGRYEICRRREQARTERCLEVASDHIAGYSNELGN
ncbi:aspartyl protease family protein [Alteromonas sp. ASW11-19]|uniref:Aspartyl protease family protein n=1 Tax=Alteromonas salexigens TaxID=2982530 RepID=A0ABT2VPV0_9ALTE|nr:aspartyl protease family protein [Alteromonas salexigens]MCU7555135.1 aspartyl protease family protein [Alteromonas salexigens]